ncbi:chorismate-binding protein [Nocardioides sp. W7]|uniref:isochorismate synthase n=1 Tax=Nocardioides sp. W7 TaxID=2931390 RepID=UPI001FD25302|nr:chorismate-binding protein [Nocardioides sp. W7]
MSIREPDLSPLDLNPTDRVAGTGEPSVVFGGADSAIVGWGVRDVVTTRRSDDPDLDAEVRGRLADDECAVGALSFRGDDPATFVVPASQQRRAVTGLGPGPTTPHRVRRHEHPSATAYARSVARALEHLEREPELRKVVLGRWLRLELEPALTRSEVVAGLARTAGLARLFAVPVPATLAPTEESSYLVGASPELLVSRRGRSVRALPLAGSAPRGRTPEEDRLAAEELLDSAKNRAEHGLVVESVAAALGPACTELSVPAPTLVATDSMWHLATDVRGHLDRPDLAPGALGLAQLLHPTPAVCGTPTERARELVAALEPPRGPMTGAVGWTSRDGDGTFVVTIRAGLLHDHRLDLFAGAGIVTGSDPASETAETGAKLRTMLRGVGL